MCHRYFITLLISLISTDTWSLNDTSIVNKFPNCKHYSSIRNNIGIYQFLNVTKMPLIGQEVKNIKLHKTVSYGLDYSYHRKITNRFTSFVQGQFQYSKGQIQFTLIDKYGESLITNSRNTLSLTTFIGGDILILQNPFNFYSGMSLGYQYAIRVHDYVKYMGSTIMDGGYDYLAPVMRVHFKVSKKIRQKRPVALEAFCLYINNKNEFIVNSSIIGVQFKGNSLQYGLRIAISSKCP